MTQTEPSDRDLWAAVAAGDEAAFGTLFDRHSRAVYNHAFRLCGSWSIAEDITQATFLTSWRKRGTVELAHASALPWLLVVAGNCARTEWRSARRFQMPCLSPRTTSVLTSCSGGRPTFLATDSAARSSGSASYALSS